MSASMINFESAWEKEQQRQLEREARQAILEKAQQEYETRQQQQEAARQRGEHTWMLPSVEAKLTRDSDTGGKKKKKKKDKKKKKKKDKKAKKSKRKDSSSSSSDNEGADDKVGEDVWVESTSSAAPSKGPGPPLAPRAAVQSQSQESSTGEGVKRDGWMEMTSLFGTFSRDEMREREGTSRKKAKEEEEKRKKEAAKPGSHARELNPYYKNGGMGLPEEQPGISSSSSTAAVATAPQTTGLDAGWLHRALQRAKEQAEAEGMTLEEVAAQRWGSLARFNELLAEAEGRGQQKRNDERNQNWRRERKRSRSREKARMRNRSREKDRMKNRSSSREKDRMRNRSRNREDRRRNREKDRMGNRSRETGKRRNISRDRDRNRSRSTSQGRGSIRRSSSSRGRDRSRSRSRERSRRDWRGRSRSRERRDKSEEWRRRHGSQSSSSSSSSSRDSSSSSNKNRSSKQGDQKDERENNTRPSDKSSKASGSSLRFQKPGDDDSTARSASWPTTIGPSSTSSNSSRNRWQKEHRQSTKERQLNPHPPTSSSSSSSSEDEAATTTAMATAAAGEPSEAPTITAVTTQPSALTQPIPLTDKEMNELAAKIVKAELVGNETLMVKLKARLEAARAVQAAAEGQAAKAGQETVRETEQQVVVLTRTDSKGVSRPVAGEAGAEAGSRMRRTKVKTHGKDGQRVKYFPDDDQHSLKNMFEREKGTTADDQNAMFEDAAMKNVERLDDDYDIDDLFMSKAALRDSAAKQAERDRKKAIQEHQRVERSLESCRRCFDNKEMPKHLIVALGTKCYLSLPAHQSLTPGHCCIVPIHHITCCLQADEDLWEEIQSFRKSLVKMFSLRGEDCIFFETAKKLQHFPHMVLQCVPLPRETGDLAPIYFKKAIMECEHEWAQNKKLVELKGRDVRRAVPKGLPYFFVDFAMDPGFAHVIEDEQTFPNHFAQEIVGGMMELDNNLWRKPLRENFEIQRRKVMEFRRWYKEFDPTQKN